MTDVSHLREPSKIVRVETKEVVSVTLNSDLLPIEWDYILSVADHLSGYFISNIASHNGRRRVVVTLTRGTNIVEGHTPASYKAQDDFLPGIELIKE